MFSFKYFKKIGFFEIVIDFLINFYCINVLLLKLCYVNSNFKDYIL